MALHVSGRILASTCGEIIAENVRSSYDRPMAKKRIVIANRSSAVIAVRRTVSSFSIRDLTFSNKLITLSSDILK
jgi:hypothetical protein